MYYVTEESWESGIVKAKVKVPLLIGWIGNLLSCGLYFIGLWQKIDTLRYVCMVTVFICGALLIVASFVSAYIACNGEIPKFNKVLALILIALLAIAIPILYLILNGKTLIGNNIDFPISLGLALHGWSFICGSAWGWSFYRFIIIDVRYQNLTLAELQEIKSRITSTVDEKMNYRMELFLRYISGMRGFYPSKEPLEQDFEKAYEIVQEYKSFVDNSPIITAKHYYKISKRMLKMEKRYDQNISKKAERMAKKLKKEINK